MQDSMMHSMINMLVAFSTDALIPVMTVVFLVGVLIRWLSYFTVRSEYKFTYEFEKRIHNFLLTDNVDREGLSFHQTVDALLQKTYYETFELKRKYRRRRFDHVTCLTDRIFLIQEGVARLITDTLKQTKYLRKDAGKPKFLEVSKFVFGANPVFNKVLGLLSLGLFNDLLRILPGLFIIGGIFGTFLGVMKALPELSHMDIGNVESTKSIMDAFLISISFSMSTSIVGIIYSVLMTLANTALSPEPLYLNLVDRFATSLEFIWNESETNDLNHDPVFQFPKDPLRAEGVASPVTMTQHPAVKNSPRGKREDRRSSAPVLRWQEDITKKLDLRDVPQALTAEKVKAALKEGNEKKVSPVKKAKSGLGAILLPFPLGKSKGKEELKPAIETLEETVTVDLKDVLGNSPKDQVAAINSTEDSSLEALESEDSLFPRGDNSFEEQLLSLQMRFRKLRQLIEASQNVEGDAGDVAEQIAKWRGEQEQIRLDIDKLWQSRQKAS